MINSPEIRSEQLHVKIMETYAQRSILYDAIKFLEKKDDALGKKLAKLLTKRGK